MSVSRRSTVAAVAAATLMFAAPLMVAPAHADPEVDPATPEVTEPAPGLLHNITYRARADGTSRGAVVAYKADDQNVNSEQPTMLPGQTFEVNTVMSDPSLAGMELSIQWPYGSNLHCEILVDDQIVARADQFIAPRLFRAKDDPLYGVMKCGAPLDNPAINLPVPDTGTPPPPPEAEVGAGAVPPT